MKRALRWIGIGLGAIVVVAGVIFAVGSSRVNRTYEVQTVSLPLVTDSAGIARGEHLTQIYGCIDCHTPNFGGQVFAEAPPFRVVASNLTSGAGGVAGQYTPELWNRAIRHGVGADGKALFIMPSSVYHDLSDDDISHIISYLVQLPPVDNELPATQVKPLGRFLAAFALDPAAEVRTDPTEARASSPTPGATVEFGQYYATVCTHCHGHDLLGAQPPEPSSPPAPSLVDAGRWGTQQFIQTMRTGVTPAGKTLDPMIMPWTMASRATDEELTGLHMYLALLGQ